MAEDQDGKREALGVDDWGWTKPKIKVPNYRDLQLYGGEDKNVEVEPAKSTEQKMAAQIRVLQHNNTRLEARVAELEQMLYGKPARSIIQPRVTGFGKTHDLWEGDGVVVALPPEGTPEDSTVAMSRQVGLWASRQRFSVLVGVASKGEEHSKVEMPLVPGVVQEWWAHEHKRGVAVYKSPAFSTVEEYDKEDSFRSEVLGRPYFEDEEDTS